ncbi:MAG TPA: MFS transporter [Gaiellaceae bacterium]
MRAILSRSDFRLLLAGQTLSMFGDWAMIIVLAVWMKVLTGSSSAAGLVFFVFAIVSLAAPLGGLVVDRLPKRRLMIATHIALAGVMCLLLLVHGRGDAWLIYVVIALYGLGGDIFSASRSAMMKAMLPDELLGDANSAYQSIREGLRIIAPLAGAGLFAVAGGSAVALVNAGTFLVSAATLVALRFNEPPPAKKEHHFLRELSAGVDHIMRTRVLRQLTLGLGGALLFIGFSETLIFAVNANSLHRPPSFIGVLSAFQGIGAIVGGITASALLKRFGDLRLTGFGILTFALGDGALLVPRLAVIAPAAAVAGVGVVWAVISLATAYQRRSPESVQGRVAAAANMLFSVPQTISIAVGAVLVTLIDYRLEIVIMTVATLASGAYLLTRRQEEAAEVELAAAA